MSFGAPIPVAHASPAPSPNAVSDAASLRVALSMIDDWDHEFSSLFALETDPTVPAVRAASATTAGKAPPSGKRATAATAAPYSKPRRGDARKAEAIELRAEIEELQRVIDAEKAKFGVGVEKCEDSLEARALRDEWERMSLRQETQRFAAQVENEKLRALVESQRKGAQKIVQLSQRVALLEQSLPTLEPRPFAEQYQGPKEDPQAQLRRLARTERDASRVFSTGRFAKGDRLCFREVQFRDRSPDADGIEINFEMAWVLPFCVDDVAEALWLQSTRITSKDKTIEWMDLYEDATAIVSQYITFPTSNENVVVNHGQLASRRLPKNERDDSIVFVSNYQARAFEHNRCKGIGSGDAWIRIERVASHKPTGASQSPLTQVKWSRCVVIHPPAYECMTPQERSQWINAVITGPMRDRVESNLDWNVQAVENILLASKPRAQVVASPVES